MQTYRLRSRAENGVPARFTRGIEEAHTTLLCGQTEIGLTDWNRFSIGSRRKPTPAQKARRHGAASDCRSLESLYFNGIAHRPSFAALLAAFLQKGE